MTDLTKEEIFEAANRHTTVLGAKERINKEEFFNELDIEYTSLEDALDKISEDSFGETEQ